MAELFTNNASTTISGSVLSTATSLTVAAGDGALYPSPSGSDFFRVVMVKLATGEWEIAVVTSRSGDIFDFGVVGNRGVEGTTALNLDDGDVIELRPTAAFFDALLQDVEMQGNEVVYAADTGSANDYQVALSPAWSGSYLEGQGVLFKASNTNTGASTLNLNGQGATAIRKNVSDVLVAGDIQSGEVVWCVYDGTYWKLMNQGQTQELLLPERASDAAAPTNALALYSKDVSGVSGLFARPSGGNVHQIPFPYDTIITTEWSAAPGGWVFQESAGEQVPIVTGRIADVGDNSQTLVDSYAHANGDSDVSLNNTNTAVGQCFTGDGNDLKFVTLYLQKVLSPTGTIVAKLYDNSGTCGTNGTPGTLRATSETIDVSTIPTSSTPIDFWFNNKNQYTLANGTDYVIVVEYTSGDASNYVNVRQDSSTPTHAGNKATYTGSWAASVTEDLIFYVYGGGTWAIDGLSVDGHQLSEGELPTINVGSGYIRNTTTGAVLFTAGGAYGLDSGPTFGSDEEHDHNLTADPDWRPPYTYVGRYKYVG